jgi:competence protein ComEC
VAPRRTALAWLGGLLLLAGGCTAAGGTTTAAPAALKAPGAVAAAPHAPPRTDGGATLEVNFLDVGQGDAALIRTPAGKTVLIDAGTGKAARRVLAFLEASGINRLDLFVWTHPHADHIGGARAVLDAIPVGVVLDSAFPHATNVYQRLLAKLEEVKTTHGTRYVVARRGRTFNLDSGITLHVLGPPDAPFSGTRSDANSNSVVVRMTYGAATFLFTGDAEPNTQAWLLASGQDLSARVLKVAHHGSRHGTGLEFMQRVRPQIAIISCGKGNSYRHPHPETLDLFKAHGVKVYRTDQDGVVRVETDGERIDIETGAAPRRSWAGGGDGPKAKPATVTQ